MVMTSTTSRKGGVARPASNWLRRRRSETGIGRAAVALVRAAAPKGPLRSPRAGRPRHWRCRRLGGGEEGGDAVGEGLDVVAAHALVGDGAGDLAQPRLQRRAPLGRVEDAGIGLAAPHQIDQRPRGGEDRAHGLAHREARMRSSGSCPGGSRAKRRLLPGVEQRQRQIGGAVGGAQRRPCRRRNTGSARRPCATGSAAGAR